MINLAGLLIESDGEKLNPQPTMPEQAGRPERACGLGACSEAASHPAAGPLYCDSLSPAGCSRDRLFSLDEVRFK